MYTPLCGAPFLVRLRTHLHKQQVKSPTAEGSKTALRNPAGNQEPQRRVVVDAYMSWTCFFMCKMKMLS